MKTTIAALALAFSVTAFADDPDVHPIRPTHSVNGQIRVLNQDPDRVIEPFGNWQFCEGGTQVNPNPVVPDGVDCGLFVAGHERLVFKIRAKNASTTAYVFTVIFRRKFDGRIIVLNGTVQRNDNDKGVTEVDLDPGAPVESWVTDTEELKNQ